MEDAILNFSQDTLITVHPGMKRLLQEISIIGGMNILIEGECGVGKTPLARYAHSCLASRNVPRSFVRINCAGLSRDRLQDEMFGHKKGAFTGADNDRIGQVELADGGDLFLDEIGDMDLQCQAGFLTFLDSGEYRRMGDPVARTSSCRIISATNKELKKMIAAGSFRNDLYSRISQYKASIPPLRERTEDIQPIMEYYISSYFGYVKPYSERVLNLFLSLDWRESNVRELRDAVIYMCRVAESSDSIDLCHVSSGLHGSVACNRNIHPLCSPCDLKRDVIRIGFPFYMEYLEHNILKELIKEEKSLRTLACKMGIPHTTLQRKLKRHGLTFRD
jgi:transcriptional regulator with PAS, ATPase and Fis domain